MDAVVEKRSQMPMGATSGSVAGNARAAKEGSPKTSNTGPNKPARRVQPRALALLLVAAIAGGFGYWNFANQPKDTGSLHVSGRIEGYETNIGPKIGGRVDYIAAREGELVKVGQTLVRISDDDVQAQLRGAKARILMAEEQVENANYQLEVINSQIEEAKIKIAQSKDETTAQVSQAESNVAQATAKLGEAEAAVAQAKSELSLADIRRNRFQLLLNDGAISTDENDRVRTTRDTAVAVVTARENSLNAARKELRRAEAALSQAKSWKMNPNIFSAQLVALQKQLIQAQHKVKTSQHDVSNAKAARDEIQANINYLNVKSPISGVVTARSVEPGAVVTPGQTLMSIINLDTVYLRGYVPEGKIGLVRVGQEVKVTLDSNPDKPFTGKVIQIDPEGSFTPENIYFKEDRVKQVFGIKIAIHQPDGYAKPGMPADAEVVLDASSHPEPTQKISKQKI